MKLKLTEILVKALEPQTKLYKVWDTDLNGFFISVLPSGTKTYMLHYRFEGLGRDYKLGRAKDIKTEAARKLALQALAKVSEGVDVQFEKKAAKQRKQQERLAKLEQFIQHRYAPWALVHHKSGYNSVRVLYSDFKFLLNRPMSQITKWDIEKWRQQQIKKGSAPATINRKIAVLKGALSRAVEWDALPASPLVGFKALPVPDGYRDRFLSETEEKRLRSALVQREQRLIQDRVSGNDWRKTRHKTLLPDLGALTFADHVRPMALLAMTTGMRRGEIFSLHWSDVDLNRGMLKLRSENTKNSKSRSFFLADEPLWILQQWRVQTNSAGLVFPNPQTNTQFDNICSAWETICKIAQLKDFRFHDLRHHYASTLEFMNLPLDTIRKQLGHSNMSVTSGYAHGEKFGERLQDNAVVALNTRSKLFAGQLRGA